MPDKIFFNSSLPRSMSTLLSNCLAQNSDFHCTPTDGFIELLLQSRNTRTNSIEFKAQDQKSMDKAFKGFCRQGMDGYYNALSDKKYVCTKSRGYSITYNFLNWFYPEPKIVVMVRDLRCIISSLEKKFRTNQHVDGGIQNWSELKSTTTDKRIFDYYINSPPLGAALNIVYDVIVQKLASKMLFIKAEEFCADPEKEMNKIYDYFEIPRFKHDFNNVEQKTFEDDDVHGGIFADHKIRQQVKPVRNDSVEVLGRHNCDRIRQEFDWYFKAFKYD